LPFPRFDAGNEHHRELAPLGRAAAEAVGDDEALHEIEAQVNEVVWPAAGLEADIPDPLI
jgi:hypothetical protein